MSEPNDVNGRAAFLEVRVGALVSEVANLKSQLAAARADAEALAGWAQRLSWLVDPDALNDTISDPTWGEKLAVALAHHNSLKTGEVSVFGTVLDSQPRSTPKRDVAAG